MTQTIDRAARTPRHAPHPASTVVASIPIATVTAVALVALVVGVRLAGAAAIPLMGIAAVIGGAFASWSLLNTAGR